MDWLAGAWAVFAKDLRLELRTRVALGALALFVAASLLLIRIALGQGFVEVPVAAALLWVVIVFAAAIGLGRSFIVEEERGTTLLLHLALRPSQVYAGKLAFNIVLMGAVCVLAAMGFHVLVPVPLNVPGILMATLALGAVGLAGSTTLLSALIARARGTGPLLPVLTFPVVVPVLMPAVALTQIASGAEVGAWEAAQGDLILMGAYAGLLISASFLLFDFVWRE